ncbi:similar to Saccharomyces cerevisiae YPR028W YOP1 Membrane protein that interacts with Yip1p to mediate membrane traffic [Maudiozyma saulgeensis]|uniref:Protein YOP1 n=1 Tax=Maudiozyma saulgeensis TaxID=1789683 RepID=A0A1X7QYF4_9SACH|nr:similar to Saccharomyces cerevisiae YPR028W YOP1 Membrane protein that interacts with Yip1p to mediate membrane traffic [Kazachstania saulgeensis]
MSDFKSSFQSQFKQFDQQFAQNAFLGNLESKTKIPRSYLISAFTFVYLLLTFLNIGGIGQILSNFAGFVLPTYFSIQAIKTTTKDDDMKLLSYWIIFGFLNVIEFWSGAIIYLIPFYWFLKVIFLVYIAIPSTGGAFMIWTKVIEPFYDQFLASRANKTANNLKQSMENASASVATGISRH